MTSSSTSRPAVSTARPRRRYYVYDAGGQRCRKVTERRAAPASQERIYLGGFEIFREDGATDTVMLERERCT